MKKFLTAILILVLAASISLTAFAADNINEDSVEASTSVKATYQASEAGTVYSVDISWGDMEFTYTAASTGTWNPATHKYINDGEEGAWSCEENANIVTITNHSNTDIEVTLSYEAAEGYDDISGAFDQNTISLDTAENTEVTAAPSDSAKLTLSGELSETAETIEVGTIIIKLTNEENAENDIAGGKSEVLSAF